MYVKTGSLLNDLFIGPKSHTSAHYELRIGDRSETHSSSGIIVSTGLGSSGWFRSILAGATGIASSLSGKMLQGKPQGNFEWDADYLYFSVREPWPSKQSSAETTFGRITGKKPAPYSTHQGSRALAWRCFFSHRESRAQIAPLANSRMKRMRAKFKFAVLICYPHAARRGRPLEGFPRSRPASCASCRPSASRAASSCA